MMKSCYVELDENNYVTAWSTVNSSGDMLFVEAPESFFGKLGCVKYQHDTFKLDENKQKELAKKYKVEPSAIELLQQENDALKSSQDIQKKELDDMKKLLDQLVLEKGGSSFE